jgi:hypothetical protein
MKNFMPPQTPLSQKATSAWAPVYALLRCYWFLGNDVALITYTSYRISDKRGGFFAAAFSRRDAACKPRLPSAPPVHCCRSLLILVNASRLYNSRNRPTATYLWRQLSNACGGSCLVVVCAFYRLVWFSQWLDFWRVVSSAALIARCLRFFWAGG